MGKSSGATPRELENSLFLSQVIFHGLSREPHLTTGSLAPATSVLPRVTPERVTAESVRLRHLPQRGAPSTAAMEATDGQADLEPGLSCLLLGPQPPRGMSPIYHPSESSLGFLELMC